MRRIGIENRGIVKGSPMPAESELSMDYTVANQKLQKWREVSLLFLKNALNELNRWEIKRLCCAILIYVRHVVHVRIFVRRMPLI